MYVRMSCDKSQDNTRHGSLMLMLYMQTLQHTHEPTHTHTHTHTRETVPGLELPCLYSSFGKQRCLLPSQPSLQVLCKQREKVGKGCHANDERDGLMDLGARARVCHWRLVADTIFFSFFLSCPFGASCSCSSGPLFPWPLRRLPALLCCCSALGRHPRPAPAVAALLAQRVRLQELSPRPIPAGVGNSPDTPENVGR